MSESDPIDAAAKALAADLHAEPDAVQDALRYLYARVAHEAGLLELVRHELRATGERQVYRDPASGTLYAVERPSAWTADDEAEYVTEMRRNLLGGE